MSIFGNSDHSSSVWDKKHWANVIKNTGSGDLLIWRQPEEDFNTNSTLVVMPGEEAIFIRGGVIESVSENGTYKLATDNYPFITRLRSLFSGGESTFSCVVYFVRKADSREIRWGTESPIQVRDKVWGVRTEVRARGAYKIRIIKPAIFLEKLIGNNIPFQTQEELQNYFHSEFQGKIKSAVSQHFNALEQELIGIDAYMNELSEKIEPSIDEALRDYGLKCVKFSLAGLDVDTSKYDKLDVSQIDLISRQRGYQADKAGLNILGNDWAKVQSANILRDLANNPNGGGMAAMGAGMGMGLGAVGTIGSMAQNLFAQSGSNMGISPNEQPAPIQNQPQTPTPSQNQPQDRIAKLRELKQFLDEGLIEKDEYDACKAEILGQLKS